MVLAAANGEDDGLNEFWRQFVVLAIGSVVVFLLVLALVAWAVFSNLSRGRRLRNAAVADDSVEVRKADA